MFTTFCNTDYRGNEDSKRSISGIVIKIGTGVISWAIKSQPFVTLSIIKAKYIAVVSVE